MESISVWAHWKVKVTQSCPTLCNPMDLVHGIFQARTLGWAAFPFSRRSSQPRDRTQVSHIAGRCFTSWSTREALEHLTWSLLEIYKISYVVSWLSVQLLQDWMFWGLLGQLPPAHPRFWFPKLCYCCLFFFGPCGFIPLKNSYYNFNKISAKSESQCTCSTCHHYLELVFLKLVSKTICCED